MSETLEERIRRQGIDPTHKLAAFASDVVELLDAKESQLAAALERVEALEAALKPFAQNSFTHIIRRDDYPMFGYDDATLTYSDFATAAALLEPQEGGRE